MSTAIEAADLKRYSDHTPTAFDSHLRLPDGCEHQEQWFIAPCSITRDSDSLALSNWGAQLKALKEVAVGDEGDFEVHRFGHWGPGWYEIVLVRPGSECHKVAAELACALESYAVLDELDWSEREQEMAWNGVSAIQVLKDSRELELTNSTMDILDGMPDDAIDAAMYRHLNVEIIEDYPRVSGSRKQLAAFLRAVRKAARS